MKPISATDDDLNSRPDTSGLLPPSILIHSGQSVIRHYNDYLHLSIRSDETRQTYRSALSLFFRFCDENGIEEILDIEPRHVRAYLDHRTKNLGHVASARTIGLMAYTFVRIGGALSSKVGDLRYDNGTLWLDMIEKGSKSHSLPLSPAPREFIETYIRECGLTDKRAPLFQSANRNGKLTGKPYDRGNSRRMISARAKALNIVGKTKNHTFRATGITHFLEGGGRLDDAQDIANHADSSTTRRYDRRSNQRLVDVLNQVDY